MSRLDTRYGAADESAGLLLWRLTNRWQAAQRAALAPLGLTHVQFVLLASLAYLPVGDTVQRDLAAHARTDPMMTSQVLRALEGKGLIERRAHPADRRARLLVITAAGLELANRAVVVVEGVDERFFAPLGADRAAFVAALRTLDAS